MVKEKVGVKEVSEREIWVGENRLYLGEDNIIYFTAVGDHTEKMAIKISEAIMKLGDMGEGKISVLIDLNKAGKPSSEARKIFREGDKHEKAGKTALFGLHPVAMVLASFFIGLSKEKDMRFFKTKEEALKWLKE